MQCVEGTSSMHANNNVAQVQSSSVNGKGNNPNLTVTQAQASNLGTSGGDSK